MSVEDLAKSMLRVGSPQFVLNLVGGIVDSLFMLLIKSLFSSLNVLILAIYVNW